MKGISMLRSLVYKIYFKKSTFDDLYVSYLALYPLYKVGEKPHHKPGEQ